MAPLVSTIPAGTCVVVRALPGADSDRHLADSVRVALTAGLARETPARSTP